MLRGWRKSSLLAAVLTLGAVGQVFAQTEIGTTAPTVSNHYPPTLPKREDAPPPPLEFKIVGSLPLGGRLTGDAPYWEKGRLLVPVMEGAVEVDVSAEDASVVGLLTEGVVPPTSQVHYVLSPDGERRFLTLPDGTVLAEHARRSGWRKEWRRRLPSAAIAQPLYAYGRLYVGALDAQVHCLQPENGHLMWAVNIGDRILRPVVMWSGALPASLASGGMPVEVLLVAGQDGGTLLGLDPYDGRKLATFELKPSEGRLASGIATLPDGRIAIGRESYADPAGDLLLLALERAPAR